MIKQINKPKVNPLSRVPRQQRLVMAIRGGAGVGKSQCIVRTRLLHRIVTRSSSLSFESTVAN